MGQPKASDINGKKRLGRLLRVAFSDPGALRVYLKYRPFTMVPLASYARNLSIAKRAASVPGCIVECGTWKGGMLAGIAEVLGPDRHYFGFDSFEGLPSAKEVDGETALTWQSNTTAVGYFDNCSASREEAERALLRSGARHVTFIKGWFENTLPGWTAPEPIALLRLDGDWYESTMTCLTHLIPQMAPGGLVLVDDYYTWDGCAKAIHDWLSRNQLPIRIRQANNDVCYFVVPQETIARLPGSTEATNLRENDHVHT